MSDRKNGFPSTRENLAFERNGFIDSLRALAALWVVLFHLSEGRHIEELKAAVNDSLFHVLFDIGHLGVAIFFVLSGYVMAMITKQTLFDLFSASVFVVKRLVRLSPPYYFAVFLALIVALAKGVQDSNAPGVSTFQVLSHLLYLQGVFSYSHLNIVFWTLCVEVQFYIFFSMFLLIAPTNGLRVKGLAFTAILGLLWPLNVLETTVWNGSFVPFWYAFSTGCLAYYMAGSANKRVEPILIAYAICLLLTVLTTRSLFATTVAFTALFLLVPKSVVPRVNSRIISQLKFVGLVSYSLYLLHNIITGSISRVLHKLLPVGVVSDLLIGSAIVLICIFASWLSFKFIEKPSINLAQRIENKLKLSRLNANI